MARQYWVAPLAPLTTTDFTAVANVAVLTDACASPQVILPAGLLEVGTRIDVTAYGRFSTTATPTLVLGLYSGTIAQAIGSAVDLGIKTAALTTATVTNQTFKFEASFQVTTVGTAGVVRGAAEVSNVASAALTSMAPATAPFANATIDTTVNRYLTLGATWSAASASNTLTVHMLDVRLVA